MKEYSILNITKNYVHSVVEMTPVFNEESKPICFLQFISNQSDFKKRIHKNISLNYQVNVIDNVYTAPKFLVQESTLYYEDCKWLKDTAFSSINSSVVYAKVIRKKVIYAKGNPKVGHLTICPCYNFSVYNCNQSYIGTVSPGQTLSIKLRLTTVQPFQTFIYSFSRTENMPQACHLLNTFEIEQRHQSDQCIEHNYTIWSQLTECELYLSTDGGITETLYIRLTVCPAGFVLCRKKGTCYCDQLYILMLHHVI